jgi:hypothetical protein
MVEENLCSEESPKKKKNLNPAIILSSYKKNSCHSGM